jgi:DNA polymerase III sliding clamp (beta) subunit (PCNA family)
MNIITIAVLELKLALTGIAKVISRRSTLPILECLRLTRDHEGIVTLQATDLDCFVTYRFPEPNPGPILDVVVPFEPVNRIVRSAKSAVSFVQDGNTTQLRTFIGQSPMDQRLETKAIEEWPLMPAISALPAPLAAEALKAIREAMDFASEDATRIALNCVHLDVSKQDAHYVVGTNGRALFSANSFKFALKESVSIPTHKLWLWNGILGQQSTLAVEKVKEDGWLKFTFGEWTFVTKQQVGLFPNWRQVVPANSKITLQFSEDAVTAVLLAVPQLPGQDQQNKPIRLRVTATQVFIEAGGTSIPVPGVSVAGTPMVIAFNRDYLLLCLKIGLTTIELIDDLSPLVFHKEGKRAVVMPLRQDATTGAPTVEAEPEPVTTPPEPMPASEIPAQPQPKEEPKNMTTAAPTETAPESTMKEALKRIDDLREDLKQVLRDLNETYTLLKQLEKEKKVTEKEVETVRAKLREIQAVKL